MKEFNFMRIGVIAFVIATVGGGVLFGFKLYDYRIGSSQMQARVVLGAIHKTQVEHFKFKGEYACDLAAIGFSTEDRTLYKTSLNKGNPVVAQHCPDCGCDGKSYKVFAFANLDEDGDFDIWVMDQDRKIAHVFNDLN